MARAVANPAAKNYGTNVLGIVAEQSDYDEGRLIFPKKPTSTNINSLSAASGVNGRGLKKNLIEFRPPFTLTPVKQFYEVERLKGNPTPDPSIPGMQMGAGELNFYLDPTLAPFWLKHLLQATSVTSTSFGAVTVGTSGISTLAAGADSTKFGAASHVDENKQPKDILQLGTSVDASDTAKLDLTPTEGMVAARIKLTFASTDVDILVKGIDQNDAPIEETLTAASARTSQTTTQYFKDKVSVQKKGTSTLTVSKVEYDLSDVYQHTLAFEDGVSEGLTLEVQEGNKDTPIRYEGLLVSRGIFMLDEIGRMQLQVIANKAFPRESMSTAAAQNRDDIEDGTDVTNFTRLGFHAVPNLGMLWEVEQNESLTVPADMIGSFRLAQIGLAIDNRLAPPRTSYADDFFYPKPVRKRNRELQSQLVIDHSKEADFDSFVGGLTFKSTLSAISRPYGGPYRAIRITYNQSQIVANPARQVDTVDEVLQSIVLRTHIGSAGAGNDDATIVVINTESSV